MSQSENTTTTHMEKWSSWKRGGLFIVIFAALSALVYVIITLFFRAGSLPVPVGSENLSSKTATVGVASLPASLDIRSEPGKPVEQVLIGNVYEGLTSLDEANKVSAGLASSWDVSTNGLTYTFHLRTNVTFSNGDKLSAEDVVWSLQQLITKKYQGSTELKKLSSVSSPDEATVILKLSSPNPELLRVLGGRAGLVFDKEATYDSATTAVGTGPFTVSEWEASTNLTLGRNTSYWGTKSQLAKVHLTTYSDASEAIKELTSGTIQGVIGIDGPQKTELEKNANFIVKTGGTTTQVIAYFNSDSTSILSDKRYRQSLRIGLDKNGAVEAAGGLGEPLGGPLSPLEPGYEDLAPMFAYDAATASRQLAYFLTRSFTVAYSDDVPDALAHYVVAAYQAAGRQVSLQKLDRSTFTQQVTVDKSFDVALSTETEGTGLSTWTSGTNWWTFDSPTADEAYTKALSSTSDSEYREGVANSAKILNEASPADWLYSKKIAAAWSSQLSGMPVNLLDSRLPLAALSSK